MAKARSIVMWFSIKLVQCFSTDLRAVFHSDFAVPA